MSKYLTTVAFMLISLIGFSQNPSDVNDSIIGQGLGDLDKDGVEEKVIVKNTSDTTDLGLQRILQIFKKTDDNWELWYESSVAIRSSEAGGMMGDPFQSIEIENGILVIHHFGGSSWKWSDIYKYRFQDNDFFLIGYTTIYGKPCEYWTNFDYNLSTGRAIYRKEYEEDCENEQAKNRVDSEEFVSKPIEQPTLSGISLGDQQLVTPKYKKTIYY